jgi:MoaA/NifB/PqqE/SkfB family radical SAM enzyme
MAHLAFREKRLVDRVTNHRPPMGKRSKLLLFDNCTFGTCNMKCRYCRSLPDPIADATVASSDGISIDIEEQRKRLQESIHYSQAYFDIPILKLSGYGEFFLLPQPIPLLKEWSNHYDRIQVITNGTKLNQRRIRQLSDIPNLIVCISLDGHTPESNCCRTADPRILHTIFQNIEYLRNSGIPVEINSVLTKFNSPLFPDFLSFLRKHFDGLICSPFPVRGKHLAHLREPEPGKRLQPLLESYPEFSPLLPPKPYLQRLISFMESGLRVHKCYVGYTALGIDPAGDILVCACNVKWPIANLWREGLERAFQKRILSPNFHKFYFPEISFSGCRTCFTHYEVLNLFLDGTISLEEIGRLPMFGGPKTQIRLQELKTQLNAPLRGGKGLIDFQGPGRPGKHRFFTLAR